MEQLPHRNPLERARSHFIDVLKVLPEHPEELSTTLVRDYIDLYEEMRQDLAPKAEAMIVEAGRRGLTLYEVELEDEAETGQ